MQILVQVWLEEGYQLRHELARRLQHVSGGYLEEQESGYVQAEGGLAAGGQLLQEGGALGRQHLPACVRVIAGDQRTRTFQSMTMRSTRDRLD